MASKGEANEAEVNLGLADWRPVRIGVVRNDDRCSSSGLSTESTLHHEDTKTTKDA
jgi:hypothetical protein